MFNVRFMCLFIAKKKKTKPNPYKIRNLSLQNYIYRNQELNVVIFSLEVLFQFAVLLVSCRIIAALQEESGLERN